MKRRRVRKAFILVNTIGTVGYLFLLTTWALFTAVILVLFIQSSSVSPSTITVVSEGQVAAGEASVAAQITGYVITVAVVLASIAIFVTLPYFIARWSSRFLRHVMKLARVGNSKRAFFFTKCIVATLPLLGFAFVGLFVDPVDMTIPAVHIATIFTGLLAMICFLFQTYAARSLNLSNSDIW